MKPRRDKNLPENGKKSKVNVILSFLRDGNISYYGYHNKSLPDVLVKKPANKLRIFQRGTSTKQVGDFTVKSYNRLIEIFETGADACFLDREALVVLLVGYPIQPEYVLARFAFRWSWIFAAPGLLRRILIKQIIPRGIVSLESAGTRQRWLLIQRGENMPYSRLSLSSEIGIAGFFDYLRNEGIQYVVLRFYQSLPKLHREWGDLDILVSDEDENRVCKFLEENPGLIRIDLWAVSSFYTGQMAYYPPPLARQILENAIVGPAGSRIPGPREAFLSFAYHALYHKGPIAGIPSNIDDIHINPEPENDYGGILAEMAKELDIPVKITMEELDEYLHQQGWRPKRDTLAKIAISNEWVSHRYFNGRRSEEKGLGVFILRKKAYRLGVADSILKMIKEEGFHILRTKEFDEKERLHAADNLRGGNWSLEGEEIEDLLPATALVVLDAYSGLDGKGGRMESMKERLRQSFDKGGASVVHSTDTTLEAWEYIEVCFSDLVSTLEEEIRHISDNSRLSFKERLDIYPKIFRYYCKKIMNYLKSLPISLLAFCVRKFLQI